MGRPLHDFPVLYIVYDIAYVVFFSQDLWTHRIHAKFYNTHKRLDKEVPQVLQKKRNFSESQSLDRKQIPVPAWGVKNYLPPDKSGEDETTLQKHIQWLVKEHARSRSKQNMEKVNRLMTITFPERRQKIVTKNMSTNDTKEEFPWLFNSDQVLVTASVWMAI